MRISILAYQLRVGGGLEVGRNVLASLARVAPQHEYQFLLPAGVGYESLEKPPRSACVYYRRRHGALGQFLFERFSVPRRVHEFHPDLVWGMASSGLRKPPAPQVILFHKPHFIYGPEHARIGSRLERSKNELSRRRLLAALPRTELVLCQTQTAAERFPRFTGYQGRIALMPNAVSRKALAGRAESPPAQLAPLAGRFALFCLTRYYPHKNLELLCDLFEQHGGRLREVAVVLTIAPNQHPGAQRLIRRIESPTLRPHFLNVGPLPPEDLAAWYTYTNGLILPTLLESFSGTYLEAMRFRRPILTSDFDFAREVCGDAAIYFDPRDPADMCEAIERLRDDAALRDGLIEAGRRQFESYVRDWDSIVAEAIGEFEHVVRRGEPSART